MNSCRRNTSRKFERWQGCVLRHLVVKEALLESSLVVHEGVKVHLLVNVSLSRCSHTVETRFFGCFLSSLELLPGHHCGGIQKFLRVREISLFHGQCSAETVTGHDNKVGEGFKPFRPRTRRQGSLVAVDLPNEVLSLVGG